MDDWLITPLSKEHERGDFSCGKAPLDTFLRSLAGQYEKRHLARTYVATEPDSSTVAGYYTLATGGLDASALPEKLRRKLPKHPIPVMHLGRLAVDTKFRGRRLGETLLINALIKSLELAEKVGMFGVDVWAIDDEASQFYQKYGFTPLVDHPHHLLLSLQAAEEAVAPR